ncbi:hypothetical protein WJX73_004534 [Symbiochloris irregularis]|uniref:Transmembrane protein n=1 Tax=Symbiochloris irregularis TaxID=706552 RepID=A0AAW1NVE9_9CHLO
MASSAGSNSESSGAPEKDKNFMGKALGGVAGVGQNVGAGVGKVVGGAGKAVGGAGKTVIGAPKGIAGAMGGHGGSSKSRHAARSEEAELPDKVDAPQLNNDQEHPELAKRPPENEMKIAYIGIAVVLVTVAFRFHWAVLLLLALLAGGVYYYAQQHGNTKSSTS